MDNVKKEMVYVTAKVKAFVAVTFLAAVSVSVVFATAKTITH